MAAETPATTHATHNLPPQPPPPGKPALHRVCIQCNGVFRVPPDRFDAKQCPACFKG